MLPRSGRVRYLVPALLLVASAPAGLLAADEQLASVQALLRTHCVKCHGPVTSEATLDLSTPRGLARGGESGPVIAASVDASLLWQRVEADEMPPDAPLDAEAKALLHAWLKAGAPGLPSSPDDEADAQEHWAFRAPRTPPVPEVQDASRVRTEIDRFIQATLESKQLSMSPDADRATLIRRVALDLTGLPPTPGEIEQYLSDSAPQAYENMVDRYLASPHYGERWGKHWLDIAGYADSNGYFSADTDRPLAYRYRDYVIRAINDDRPFDRFLREQLAGDELSGFRPGAPTTPEDIELLTATHFLRNGQDGTDIGIVEPEALEIDRRAALEAAVQVTATSLLGLTLHCARCHDHKFEPITQQEYYAFQAILFPAFNPQDWTNPKDRVVYAYLPGEKEEWESRQQQIEERLATLQREYQEWRKQNREPSEVLFEDTFDDDAWTSRWSNTAPGDDAPGGQLTIASTTPHAARVAAGALQIVAGPGEAWLATATSFDWTPAAKDDWIQATFDLVDTKIAGPNAERIGYTLAAQDFDDSGSVAGGNVLIDGNPSAATSIYADYPGTDQHVVGSIGSRGYTGGRNYGVRVTNVGDGKYRLEHMFDGFPEGPSLELGATDLPDGAFAFFYCAGRSFIVDNVRVERSAASAESPELTQLRATIEKRRKQYDEQRKELESERTAEPGRAIAWVTDKSANPPEVPLLTRGLYHLRGPNVAPAALSALTDPGQELSVQPPSVAATTGRRLAFAEWLTRPEGRAAALVARVHVNRIWRQYFERGIVPTTDNLGLSGASPTHPDLLDYLAHRFMQGGWSQKALHRLIVCSTVYRQSSAPRPDGLAADPDNRYWWRWPLRRLEAEVLRDSMLAVSGQLDRKPHGPYVSTEQTPVGEVIVDESQAGARRRSVYLQQRRSQTLSLLKVFDAPAIATSCSTRVSSTVPLQSLALLNSDFALARSDGFASRLMRETDGTPGELVAHAWRIAIGRAPTANEAEVAQQFLAEQQAQYSGPNAPTLALADFCQMLLASNLFLYIE